MDSGKRLSNLPPVARGPIDGLDCLKDQDTSTHNRNNTDRSGCQDARTFREKPQSGQFNLELFKAIRRFTEFSKYRIGAIRKDGRVVTGELCHVPGMSCRPAPPGALGNQLFHGASNFENPIHDGLAQRISHAACRDFGFVFPARVSAPSAPTAGKRSGWCPPPSRRDRPPRR